MRPHSLLCSLCSQCVIPTIQQPWSARAANSKTPRVTNRQTNPGRSAASQPTTRNCQRRLKADWPTNHGRCAANQTHGRYAANQITTRSVQRILHGRKAKNNQRAPRAQLNFLWPLRGQPDNYDSDHLPLNGHKANNPRNTFRQGHPSNVDTS